MDDLQTRPVTASAPDLAELQASHESLRNLVFSILVLVVVLSGTFNIFLWRQVRYAHKDLEAIRKQATEIISGYQKSGPMMDSFLKQVAEYGRTHPDFAPILAKYGISPMIAPAGTTSPGAATPAPAPPAAPKK